MQRYFGIKNDNKITINESDIFHIKTVMRMKVKDKIEVVFDKTIYLCNIKSLDPFCLEIINETKNDNELSKQITIAQGLVKEQKMDTILQKCTELGIKEFIPLALERAIVKLDGKEDKKIERWNRICKEASEQSFRNDIPKIYSVMKIDDLINLNYDLKIVCSTKKTLKTIKNILQTNINCVRILVVIGPEGGISEKEEEFLNKNGFISVSLGNRILRTETAPIFVMSAINYEEMKL